MEEREASWALTPFKNWPTFQNRILHSHSWGIFGSNVTWVMFVKKVTIWQPVCVHLQHLPVWVYECVHEKEERKQRLPVSCIHVSNGGEARMVLPWCPVMNFNLVMGRTHSSPPHSLPISTRLRR